MLGCFCFGIVLGSISSMIQGSNMGKLAYDEIYQEVMQYMRYRKVSHLVRHQVRPHAPYTTTHTPAPPRTPYPALPDTIPGPA